LADRWLVVSLAEQNRIVAETQKIKVRASTTTMMNDDPSDVGCCPPYLALLLVTANINYHVADAVPTHRVGREAIICLDRVEAILLFQRQSKECPLENPTE
jgi:hypothetical protein